MYQNYMNANPMISPTGQFSNPYTPRQEIVKVHGENGARAYNMAANSSALLLDDSDPIVWLVQTDGAGYKTVTPYSITLYQPAPHVDANALEARIARLEELVNAKSDSVTDEPKRTKSGTSKASVE